jgi:hypothetical protein
MNSSNRLSSINVSPVPNLESQSNCICLFPSNCLIIDASPFFQTIYIFSRLYIRKVILFNPIYLSDEIEIDVKARCTQIFCSDRVVIQYIINLNLGRGILHMRHSPSLKFQIMYNSFNLDDLEDYIRITKKPIDLLLQIVQYKMLLPFRLFHYQRFDTVS